MKHPSYIARLRFEPKCLEVYAIDLAKETSISIIIVIITNSSSRGSNNNSE